jgi:hypothetical protein
LHFGKDGLLQCRQLLEKLAVIIWSMVTKKIHTKQLTNTSPGSKKESTGNEKLIHKFDITPDDLGLQLNINNL